MTRLDRGTLNFSGRPGAGEDDAVYQVHNLQINQKWEAVYKEYRAQTLPGLDAAALERMVDLVPQLSADDRDWLLEHTAWPATLVTDNDAACGYLMRSVPTQFRFEFQTIGSSGLTATPARFDVLLNADDYVAGAGLRISERDRLLLLAELAVMLSRLSRLGVVVGDLSGKNLLFSTTPAHRCFLVDCDATRLNGTSALPQTQTPGWEIFAGEEQVTTHSDSYKFGLLAIRLIARDRTTRDPGALGRKFPALAALAAESLAVDPARRPLPAAWIDALRTEALTASAIHAVTTESNPAAPMAYIPAGTTEMPVHPAPSGPPAPQPQPAQMWQLDQTIAPPAEQTAGQPYGQAYGSGQGYGAGQAYAPDPAQPFEQQSFGQQPFGQQPLGQQPFDPQQSPQQQVRNRRVAIAGVAGLAAVGLVIGLVIGLRHSPSTLNTSSPPSSGASSAATGSGPSSSPPTTAATTATPTSADTTDASPTMVGAVGISPSIAGDPRAAQVASLFDTYFTGVDQQDYATVLADYDPSGSFNTNNAQQVSEFEQGVSTSDDTAVELLAISPGSQSSPVTSAEVTFQSTQSAGYGPAGNTDQTCTDWELTYVLTQDASGDYLIFKTSGVSDHGC